MRTLPVILVLAAYGATRGLADVVYVTALPAGCTTTSVCGTVSTDGSYVEVGFAPGQIAFSPVHGTAPGRPPTPGSRDYISAAVLTNPNAGVDITPALAANDIYEIDYNWNNSMGNGSTDVIFSLNCTGGTLSSNSTPVFQRAYGISSAWNFVCYLTNSSLTPTVSFHYQSGLVCAASQSRIVFDCWRFRSLPSPCLMVPPVGVTGPLGANSAVVSVTGVSSTATKVTLYQGSAPGVFTNIGSLAVTSPGLMVSVPVTEQLVRGAQVAAAQTIGGVDGCVPVSGTLVGGGYSPAIRIAASIRQPKNVAGPVGSNGGSASADLYWIHATGMGVAGGFTVTPSTNWQTIAFNPDDASHYLWNGLGDGLTFPDPYPRGIFEGFAIASADANDCGPIQVYFDNLRNGATLIQDFENETNAQPLVLFNQPSFSGTTSFNLLSAPNTSAVAQSYASTGTNSLGVSFQFVGLGWGNWLRLNSNTTNGTVPTPNPIVDLTQPILVDVLLLPPNQTASHALGRVSPTNSFYQVRLMGSSAGFGVTVTPPDSTTPTYAYAWKLNGAPIPGATDSAYTRQNLTPADAGTYVVTVSDGTASVTLTNSVLAVLTQTPTITQAGFNQTNVTLLFPTEAGPIYVIEYKDRLSDSSWQVLASIVGTGQAIPLADAGVTNATRFYRLRVQ
ncbi:MAG TPA: hypothetical protein VMU04_11315 [Candidatus Acidoferrum sp.]|nr:hypothetical protein [Candidatus Acidoferrum sp.]